MLAGISIGCLGYIYTPAQAIDYTVTIDGSSPATVLQGGDTVTVSGYMKRAMYAYWNTEAIVVENGGVTLTNWSFSGGSGLVTADSGGNINLGTGSVINVGGTLRPPGSMGPTGLFANGAGSIITARDLTVNVQSDKSYGIYSRAGGAVNLTGQTTSIFLTVASLPQVVMP
ncbi:hypothetical protein WJT86_02055 [Microvirga sp. W0021]|uniref:Uncharacterized protein n=1 Tax=Hohaiivirga grylli TaxID=3133970 RepID=A0ABV0BFT6_9HYPH